MQSIRTMILVAGLCLVSAVDAAPAAAQATLTCESTNNQFRECRVQTGGRVRLTQNISNTRCVYGRTWGFDWNTIWVDRGCRGRFAVNGSGTGWESGNFGQRVTCESQGGSFKICNVATNGHVRLIRQISQASCTPGRTWGYQGSQIWVANGCRAEFEVGRGSGGWQGNVRVLTCESQDGQYSRCFARTEGRVTMQRQISSTACVLNRTWGYDANGVWVNNGCRAQFAVGGGGPGSGWAPYPGTWPGPGGPTPPTGGGLVDRGRAACVNKASTMGYRNVNATGTRQSGSNVYVEMNARSSQGRNWQLKCTYRQSSGSALITDQSEVGNGGGGGGSNLYGDAKAACENKAKVQGYQVIGSGPASRQSWGVKHDLDLRKGGLQYSNGYCNYQSSSRSATVVPGTPDKQPK